MIVLHILVSATFMGLCVATILFDLRDMRIPNVISLAYLALFVVWAALAWSDIALASRLGLSAVVFAVTFALFALRLMGGGDTKVLSAMALFIPIEHASSIVLLFSLCLLASIAVVLALRAVVDGGGSQWAVLSRAKLPMGLAIGATGLIAQAVSVL